jgi:hypothetical protein
MCFDVHSGEIVPPEVERLVENAHVSMLRTEYDNDEFELIPALADIDGTLAMFSTKFLKEFSYGSFTWGVIPFISDLKALLTSLQDIFSSPRSRYNQCILVNRKRFITYGRSFTDPNLWGGGVIFPAVTAVYGIARAKGAIIYRSPDFSSLIGKGLYLLDELGVHPDLKTAWDIIPLSFVLDYFIPIGDILETLHPRGWGSSSLEFEGFLSSKLRVEYSQSCFIGSEQAFTYVPMATDRYRRQAYKGPRPLSGTEWKSPTMKELFNTAYLTTVLKRIF